MTGRTLTASLAAVSLLLAACGDDDGDDGDGSAADFCALITADSPVFTEGADEQESIAALRELADAAPREIRRDIVALLEANIEISEINFDELTDEEFVELSERFADVEVNQRNAEEWVLANCNNVPDDFFQT